ncbi:hypothetical protein ABEX47_02070 [Paenibacillus ehimensis]|uniref:hypothetical protein n=1 Tax=Paenibacillus ehimensis TaxID=79264 RepID=UPI003D289059
MPDWSYQTLFRPLLFGLPAETARDFTLGAMGLLSRLPGGTLVIKTLGHMESHPILESEACGGLRLKYPVGLSGGLDVHGTAHRALAQFGFGFIEIGPVTVREVTDDRPIRREVSGEALLYPNVGANEGLEKLAGRMQRKQGHRLPLMFRLRPMPGASPEQAQAELRQMMERLAPWAAAFYIDSIDTGWPPEATAAYLHAVRQASREAAPGKPLLLYVAPDDPAERLQALLSRIDAAAWEGIVVGDAVRTPEAFVIGREALAPGVERVKQLRQLAGPELTIVLAGGIHEPRDALLAVEAGADCVQLHSGLVYSGPGLPKRINEALIYEKVRETDSPPEASFWRDWGWMCLLGIGMILGGILAWMIAATTVMLPYDVLYLGMDQTMLGQANRWLLGFMSHDRVTLAGTMISIGILYYQLARHGLRKGLHWTKTALMTSGLVGFSSFFLYLGYGYFDPLHALAAAVLLPMFILSMRARADRPSYDPPNLANDRIWRRAQWGQLLFVTLGFALAVGGVVIAGVGITFVFVPTDLAYLCASAEMLADINERLIPLIAHDRAGFGGALFSNALAVLIIALWGIGQGQRWVWWTLLLGGLPGFLAGLSVHFQIGYTDFIHLLPAYFACLLYVGGLILLYPYLMQRPVQSGIHGGRASQALPVSDR